MFERVFIIVERLTGCKIKWRHLDNGEGFQAVVSDMGGGQLKGNEFLNRLRNVVANAL